MLVLPGEDCGSDRGRGEVRADLQREAERVSAHPEDPQRLAPARGQLPPLLHRQCALGQEAGQGWRGRGDEV